MFLLINLFGMLILKSNYLSINKDKKNQRNKYGCREEIDGRAQAVAVIMLLKWVTVGWANNGSKL